MPIIIKNRAQHEVEAVEKVIAQLEGMEQEVVDQTKYILDHLVSIEALYDIRDYIDELILGWVDQEIVLEDDDL